MSISNYLYIQICFWVSQNFTFFMYEFNNGILSAIDMFFLFLFKASLHVKKQQLLQHPLLTFCGMVTDHWLKNSKIFYIWGFLLLEAILTSHDTKRLWLSYDGYEFHDLNSPLGSLGLCSQNKSLIRSPHCDNISKGQSAATYPSGLQKQWQITKYTLLSFSTTTDSVT